MKLLPEGFQALLAPAAMLPAALPRPDWLPMVSAMFVLGVPAGKYGVDIVTPASAGVHMVASASAAIMDSFFIARSPLLLAILYRAGVQRRAAKQVNLGLVVDHQMLSGKSTVHCLFDA
jgi:hypothetical protein